MKISQILLATMISFSTVCQDMQESIRQIDEHITYLHSLYHNHYTFEKHYSGTRYEYSALYGYFKHPLIITCIADMQKNSSLEPFFSLWDTIKKSMQFDEVLLEECALLTITFFNNLHAEISDGSRTHNDEEEITVDEIIELYNRLAAMPLTQLITLLNGIVDCVVTIIKTTPIGQTLFAWLHAPWWEPVLMISSYIIKLLLTQRYSQGDSPSYISVVY